jgi:hypothetical protein
MKNFNDFRLKTSSLLNTKVERLVSKVIMKNLIRNTCAAGFALLIVLTATVASAQTPPKIELPKMEEPKIIGIAYNRKGQGQITAADREGKVHQYMEVWEDKSKIPNVITYMLIGQDRESYFSITWGRGPVNREVFACTSVEVPEFGEKSFWVTSVTSAVITFTEIKDEDVKGLFANLTRARRDWDLEVSSNNPKRNANTTQNNILDFLKKKNREKWLQNGWLQPATNCVRHF